MFKYYKSVYKIFKNLLNEETQETPILKELPIYILYIVADIK